MQLRWGGGTLAPAGMWQLLFLLLGMVLVLMMFELVLVLALVYEGNSTAACVGKKQRQQSEANGSVMEPHQVL